MVKSSALAKSIAAMHRHPPSYLVRRELRIVNEPLELVKFP